MNCPHCGTALIPGNKFCHRCRKRVAAEPAAPSTAARPASTPRPVSERAAFARPPLVTVLAVLNFLGAFFGLGMGALLAFGGMSQREAGPVILGLGLVLALMAGLQLATGVGLLGLKPWARTLQIGIAVLGLLGIPCGTVVSILVLLYMVKPEVKLLFSGASPGDLAPEDAQSVERLGQASAAVYAVVAVVVCFVGIAGVGIVAAIAIPSLLRARVSANESATIGDLRTIFYAQGAYAAANGGHYDRLQCLQQPSECIPGYPATAPRFLDADFENRPLRAGYRFSFEPGQPAPDDVLQGGKVSPSSVSGWTYCAVPATPGQTGVRAFCAMADGSLCASPDGRLGPVAESGLPEGCEPLR